MSTLSARETHAVAELAAALYDFLPGTPHPRADSRISFPGAATVAGVGGFWSGGSKLPAVTQLLRATLEQRRGSFCSLISAIVANALIYRQKKSPLTRKEMERVNALVFLLGFKIPDLWDVRFLESLASGSVQDAPPRSGGPNAAVLKTLHADFLGLLKLDPQPRGYAFERTLNELFHAFELAPRSAFRLVGEQIDGSFELIVTYLVEAKWTAPPIGAADLTAFSGKVKAKSDWARGLYISYTGYSEDGLEAFGRGRATNIVCMDGKDLYHVLGGEVDLRKLIELKARRASETGRAFVPTRDLFANII